MAKKTDLQDKVKIRGIRRRWLLNSISAVFLILLLVILLISRRRKQKREAQQESQRGTVEAPPPVQKADIMEMQTERSMELRQDIRKFTEENPEIAAQMVRNWLREGETK